MHYTLNSLIYRNIIDPILSSYYSTITDEIAGGERVIDIASGTGSLGLAIAGKGADVTGIDLSEEMVEIAGRLAEKRGIENAEFLLRDAGELSAYTDNEFDVAVTSMAVHQFDEELAVKILKEMKRIAGRIIIMDYNYPMKKFFPRMVVWIIEKIAGGDHYRNFRNYNRLGGADHFIEKAGLKIKSEKLSEKSTFRVVVAKVMRG